jgi:hypothetical protein
VDLSVGLLIHRMIWNTRPTIVQSLGSRVLTRIVVQRMQPLHGWHQTDPLLQLVTMNYQVKREVQWMCAETSTCRTVCIIKFAACKHYKNPAVTRQHCL